MTARALAERNDLPLSEAVSLFQQTVRQRREHHLREAQRLIFPASASHAAHSEADSESSFWGPERFGSLPSEALEVLRDDEKPLEALDRPLRDAYQTVFAELRSQGVITNKEWLPLLRTALTRYADTPLEVSAEVADYARATTSGARCRRRRASSPTTAAPSTRSRSCSCTRARRCRSLTSSRT